MFDLEQSIAEWRRQLIAGGIKSRDVLDELESHLREDIDEQLRSGRTAEQAFHEAAQRIGRAEKLKLEFGKVSLPQSGFSRKVVNGCCAGFAVFVFLVERWTLQESDATPAEKFWGVILISIIAGYIGALPRFNRMLKLGVSGWTLRKKIANACNCAVLLWVCLLLLSTVNVILLPSGIVLSVVCWALFAAAIATVVVIAHGMEPDALNLWTPESWQCLEVAGVEAARFHHDFIGTEHVLLGLLETENSSVSKILGKMGVRTETVRAEIEKIVGSGPQSPANRAPAYTPRAKKALAIAFQEAKTERRNRVEPEHIFLGLLREGSGVAAKVLTELGVNTITAREEILKERGDC